MTLYAIGDVQGCADSLESLLSAIAFSPDEDQLWLVGDLVNRGPDSLAVLRTVMALGERATTVLGNHDLHFLATVVGVRPPQPQDTLEAALSAPDRDAIVDWLRHRPMLHHDARSQRALVHAGIPPGWSISDAERNARDVEAMLRSARWAEGIASMYGDGPSIWNERLDAAQRRRYAINAFTRMRFCHPDGALDFEHTGAPGTQGAGLVPWFDHPRRATRDVHVVFGHWATLGLLQRTDITATDSGCVWGGKLTAVPLDPPGEPIAIDCCGHRGPG